MLYGITLYYIIQVFGEIFWWRERERERIMLNSQKFKTPIPLRICQVWLTGHWQQKQGTSTMSFTQVVYIAERCLFMNRQEMYKVEWKICILRDWMALWFMLSSIVKTQKLCFLSQKCFPFDTHRRLWLLAARTHTYLTFFRFRQCFGL